MKSIHRTATVAIALGLLVVLMLGAVGCSERIKGTQAENRRPIVQFTNIPPDGSRTPRNPVVYWAGFDTDGQVKAFAYVVVLESDMGGATPEAYLAQVRGWDSTRFIWLAVTVNNPQTKQVISMQADINNPVGVYRTQYVYLKARDNEGAESDIIFKRFQRNDNIPDTRIRLFGGSIAAPYIDRPPCAGAITGIDIGWRGEDLLDYPKDPPPFEFQWKLLGPYGTDTVGQRLGFDSIRVMYVQDVFVTLAGRVYDSLPGNNIPDTLILCDTVIGEITCDTTLVRNIPSTTSLGRWLTYFNIDDPSFINSDLYRVVDSSTSADLTGWTSETFKTFCNVFSAVPSNTTRQEKFFFWARARDDAKVPDPVPAFEPFDVLDPKFERSVLVVDFAKEDPFSNFNGPKVAADGFENEGKKYWHRVINTWEPTLTPTFDTTVDYRYFSSFSGFNGTMKLQELLKYKVIVLYGDEIQSCTFWEGGVATSAVIAIYTAIDAGVNVWSMMKVPAALGQHPWTRSSRALNWCDAPLTVQPDPLYRRYFGVETMTFHGWLAAALAYTLPDIRNDTNSWCTNPPQDRRMEDFSGAVVPQGFGNWPAVLVDTANLHERYFWLTVLPPLAWMPDVAAPPEINWTARSYGTEIMYLFKQKRPGENTRGPGWNLEGRPVGYRYRTSIYRTALFNFTPLGLEDGPAQVMIDTVMNFLYEPWRDGSGAAMRDDPQALVRFSASEVKELYNQRREMIERANEAEQKRLNPGYRTTMKD